VIQGYDSNDPGTQICIETNNAPLTDNGIKGKRLGVMRSFFGQSPENTEVNEVMRSALLQFNETGACLVEIPDFVDSNELVRDISVHQYDLRAHLNQYLAAQIAPVHSLQEIIDSGLFHPGSKTDLLLANSLKVDSTEYKERQLRQIETRQWLKDLFTKYALDGIIYPHQQQLVCKVGGSQQQRNGVLASVTGFPAACIPAGFSLPTEDAPMGVPIGLEILGLPFEEHKILEIAYSFEQSTHLRRPPQEKHWL
jgi:Asp-tRNA(Asn)/Glu-tRNA(Gln) amidotransferase A subunit family amidase